MSQIKVNTIVDAAGGTTASINGYTPTMSNMAGRNRIINGAMVIDQRNAGASVTAVTGTTSFPVDRWQCTISTSSKFSAQRNAGSVTPPTGFSNYLGATSLSAYSVGSVDYFALQQNIEGFNTADLAWGTASAATVTLSFWVRSSLTGTFGGGLKNGAANRTYPFTYTISAANTWEYKTVTIAGDTSGTWATDNTNGIAVMFGLGVGSTYSGTAGSWAGANYVSATGATSVVGTNGATFYITGVQLEAGSVATPFEHRQYGQELALCQRYYQRITALNSYHYISNWGSNASGTVFRTTFPLKTAIRAAVTSVDFSNLVVDDNGTVPGVTALVVYGSNTFDHVGLQATVSSGLTTFRPAVLASGVGTGFVGISAEF